MSLPSKPRILILGEYYGEAEELSGRPFDGPTGSILFNLLRQVGIPREDCYFTNVFNLRPKSNRLESLCGPKSEAIEGFARPVLPGKFIRQEFAPEIERLYAELDRVKPNVVVALGNVAFWAMTKKTGIKKYRGAPIPSHCQRYKVIPTWGPGSIQRQWELRPIVYSDLSKAREQSAYPDIRRPVRYIYLEPTIDDLYEFYNKFLDPAPYVSCDIETKGGLITEVGFGTSERALVIPFYQRESLDGAYWPTAAKERKAWDFVRMVCREKPTIGQNFAYDMQYFWRVMGIPCPKFLGDTMLAQHSLQPEMEKGLGFLASVYTDEPSWKFMRQEHSHLKKGDE